MKPFDLIPIAVTAIAAALVWFRIWEPVPHVSMIGVAGILFGGWPNFHEAFVNLRARRMTMELSMTIVLAALGIGEGGAIRVQISCSSRFSTLKTLERNPTLSPGAPVRSDPGRGKCFTRSGHGAVRITGSLAS